MPAPFTPTTALLDLGSTNVEGVVAPLKKILSDARPVLAPGSAGSKVLPSKPPPEPASTSLVHKLKDAGGELILKISKPLPTTPNQSKQTEPKTRVEVIDAEAAQAYDMLARFEPNKEAQAKFNDTITRTMAAVAKHRNANNAADRAGAALEVGVWMPLLKEMQDGISHYDKVAKEEVREATSRLTTSFRRAKTEFVRAKTRQQRAREPKDKAAADLDLNNARLAVRRVEYHMKQLQEKAKAVDTRVSGAKSKLAAAISAVENALRSQEPKTPVQVIDAEAAQAYDMLARFEQNKEAQARFKDTITRTMAAVAKHRNATNAGDRAGAALEVGTWMQVLKETEDGISHYDKMAKEEVREAKSRLTTSFRRAKTEFVRAKTRQQRAREPKDKAAADLDLNNARLTVRRVEYHMKQLQEKAEAVDTRVSGAKSKLAAAISAVESALRSQKADAAAAAQTDAKQAIKKLVQNMNAKLPTNLVSKSKLPSKSVDRVRNMDTKLPTNLVSKSKLPSKSVARVQSMISNANAAATAAAMKEASSAKAASSAVTKADAASQDAKLAQLHAQETAALEGDGHAAAAAEATAAAAHATYVSLKDSADAAVAKAKADQVDADLARQNARQILNREPSVASAESAQAKAKSVLISSRKVDTDALAVMKYVRQSVKHTNVSFDWVNQSLNPATFRVVTASKDYVDQVVRSGEVTVAAGTKGTATCTGLKTGTKYFFFLQRLGGNTWEQQAAEGAVSNDEKSYLSVTTRPAPIVNVSTTSIDAVLEWRAYPSVKNTVEIYESSALRATGDDPFKIINFSDMKLVDTNSKWRVSVRGLSHGTTYYGVVSSVEVVGSANEVIDVAQFEFDASPRANMKIGRVAAASVDLSWDTTRVGADEQDGVADFNFTYEEWLTTKMGLGWVDRGVLMESKPDTTRQFTAQGLNPGTLYKISLNRLDFTGAFAYQAHREISTKTSRLTLSGTTSTFVTADWDPAYDGATYRIQFESQGRVVSSQDTNATTKLQGGLLPDSTYDVTLSVKESSGFVVLDAVSVKTAKMAELKVVQPKHTVIDMVVAAPGTASAYYVSDGSGKVKTPTFNVSNLAGEKRSTVFKEVELTGVALGTTYDLTLYRQEHGKWVAQGSVSTRPVSATIVTSVSTEAALIRWENQYPGAEYQVRIFQPGGDFSRVMGDNDVVTDGDGRSVLSTALDKNTKYGGELLAHEQGDFRVVTGFNFQTSLGATFLINDMYASYAKVTWDDQGVGSDEEDSEAEFMVKVRNSKTNAYVFESGWLPDSISNVRATGLSPGVEHNFSLYRRGVDGKAVRQAGMDLHAKTTELTVSELSSSRMVVSWASIYPDARYKLTYTAEGGVPITFGGGTMAATTALLSDLDASTEYQVELWVEERGEMVPISTAALGSALTVSTTLDYKLIAAFVTAVVVLFSLVLTKMRK